MSIDGVLCVCLMLMIDRNCRSCAHRFCTSKFVLHKDAQLHTHTQSLSMLSREIRLKTLQNHSVIKHRFILFTMCCCCFFLLNAYKFYHLSQCGCSRSQRAREREQPKTNGQKQTKKSVVIVVAVAVVLGWIFFLERSINIKTGNIDNNNDYDDNTSNGKKTYSR